MKRFLRATVITLVALMALSAGAVPAFAASPSAASLRTGTSYARSNVDIPVFGIDLIASGGCTTFTDLVVDFVQVAGGGTFDSDDLESSGADAGVTLWRDSGATADQLDAGDTEVPTSFTITTIENGFRANLEIDPDALLPAAEEGSYTYFLAIRLSSLVTNGDDVQITLPSDAFRVGGNILCLSDPSITAVSTGTIIADTVAPTVTTFTPALAQTANIYWILSEPIVGVDEGAASDNVVLRVTGTTHDLPATVSYNAATKTITLDPAGTLFAGQSYDAKLLPNGAGTITDAAGNELAAKTNTFRVFNVEESAYGATYNWRKVSTSAAYGGSYLVNNYAGGAATFKFTGTSIVWYTITDPYQGKVTVYIDGVSKGTFNNYASTAKYRVPRSFTGLSNASHTIAFKVTGLKGSTVGKDARVSIDAFKVGATLNSTPALTMRWATVSTSSASGGVYYASRFPWSDMTFVFYGTGVDWKTIIGPNMGRAAVYIDGVSKGVVDNYAGSTHYKYVRSYTGLSQGLHTIRIQVYGTRNANAKDSIIAVDGFTAK